jgi:hypothetical protein
MLRVTTSGASLVTIFYVNIIDLLILRLARWSESGGMRDKFDPISRPSDIVLNSCIVDIRLPSLQMVTSLADFLHLHLRAPLLRLKSKISLSIYLLVISPLISSIVLMLGRFIILISLAFYITYL